MALTTVRIIPESFQSETDHGALYLKGYFSRAELGRQVALLPQNQIDELTRRRDAGLKYLFNQVRGWGYAEDPTIAGTRESLNLFRIDEVRYSWDAETQSVTTHLVQDTDGEVYRSMEGEGGGMEVPFVRLDTFTLLAPTPKTPTAREIARWEAAYN